MADTFLRALAQEAKLARAEGECTQVAVAVAAGVSNATISRFEQGEQPERLAYIVAAYEAECGLEPFELWERAVERARE